LAAAKVRERLTASKRMVKKMDVERFNLKQLNEEEVKKQFQVTIKHKSAALENLDDNGDNNRAWDTIRDNVKISAKESIGLCESKSYKPWFDEECLKLVMEGSGLKYCNVFEVLFTMELYCTPKSQYITVKHSQQLFEHT
jgi:hypothetical protein